MTHAQRLYQLTVSLQLTLDEQGERGQLERIVLLETHGMVKEILEKLRTKEQEGAKS